MKNHHGLSWTAYQPTSKSPSTSSPGDLQRRSSFSNASLSPSLGLLGSRPAPTNWCERINFVGHATKHSVHIYIPIYILYIVCVNNCFKLLSEPKITQTHGSCPRAMGMHNCCFGTLGNWRISENSTAEIPWCANPNGQLGNEPNVAKRGQTIKTQQSHRVGHFSFSFPPASPIFEATHDQTSSPICAFPHRLPCLPIAPGGWTQSTD